MTDNCTEELSESSPYGPASVSCEHWENSRLYEVKLHQAQGVEVPVFHNVSPTEHSVEG